MEYLYVSLLRYERGVLHGQSGSGYFESGGGGNTCQVCAGCEACERGTSWPGLRSVGKPESERRVSYLQTQRKIQTQRKMLNPFVNYQG